MTDTEFGLEMALVQGEADLTFVKARDWQRVFDELTDLSKVKQLQEQAAAELDAMFPYKGQHVYMSGNGLKLIQDTETFAPIGESWEYIEACEGLHNGFAVIESEDDGDNLHYRVMQQIYIASREGMAARTVHQKLMLFNYFDLDSHCLVIDNLNKIFYPEDKPFDFSEQIGRVVLSSQTLTSLLRSTTFRRMQHRKQKRQVAKLVTEAEQNANLRGIEILARGEYGYIQERSTHGHIMPVDLREFVIGGLCLGLESLESLSLLSHAIRRDANMIDKEAGLCLVLDPNEETKQGLYLNAEQLLYVPVGQELELERYK